MNCAKSVKMIVMLGCIVVNLVGCGMTAAVGAACGAAVYFIRKGKADLETDFDVDVVM